MSDDFIRVRNTTFVAAYGMMLSHTDTPSKLIFAHVYIAVHGSEKR